MATVVFVIVLLGTVTMLVVSVAVYAVVARFMPRARAAVAAPLLVACAVVLWNLLPLMSEQDFSLYAHREFLGFLAGITAFVVVMLLAWVHYTVPRPKR